MTDYSDDAFAEIGAFEIDPSLHPAYHGLPPETSDAQIISGFESPKRLHSFWFSLFQRAWGNRRLCGAVSRPSGKARKWWFSGRNMWVYRLKERFSGRNMSVYRLKERLLGCRWCPQRSIYGGSLWFLGTHYVTTSSFTSDDDDDDEGRHIERNAEFEADFHSRVYITYRKGFEAVGSRKFTTDVGWGCMIRSCQMLLAQALVCHLLGRTWRHSPFQPSSRIYLEILQYFGDSYSHDCPFSIHNILLHGAPYGLMAGLWLGPYAMCCSLQALAESERLPRGIGRSMPFAIHVVSGENNGERGGAPCLYMDAVMEICSRWVDCRSEWSGLLVLIPLVLGLKKINPRYLPLLAETFTFPQSVGMIGGKPGASTYLVGVKDDRVFYLDPHLVQQVCIISPDNPKVDTSSYHCSHIKHMPLSSTDPSLALGFYCRDQEDFVNFCDRASQFEMKANGAPLFSVVRGRKENKSHSLFSEPKTSTTEHTSSDEEWEIL